MKIGDYEVLYMIRKNDPDALEYLMSSYHRLFWARTYQHYHRSRIFGMSEEDFYQEARLGFMDAIFSYQEESKTGLAHYIDICVTSRIKTNFRRCMGLSYRLLDPSYSLDMSISEDDSLTLYDTVEDNRFSNDPVLMAQYKEASDLFYSFLESLSERDREIYLLREEGYSYNEIASLMHINVKKVDNIIQKVRRLLNRYLEEKLT